MSDFKNEFSWSVSRDALFTECKRKYYYNYYGSWGGWDSNISDTVARELYVLKNLQLRWMWKGNAVHHEIERILKELISTGSLTPFEKSHKRVTGMMRRGFKSSREGGYRKTVNSLKNELALFEHEYETEVSNEAWKRNYNETISCLENFYKSEVLETVRNLNRNNIVTIESMKPSCLSFSDEQFFIKIDLAYKLEDKLQIVDWKTGSGESNTFQFLVYVIYANEELNHPLEDIRVLEHNLIQNKQIRHHFNSVEIENAKNDIMASIDNMKGYLSEVENNLATMTDFERTENRKTCDLCNFKKICFELD